MEQGRREIKVIVVVIESNREQGRKEMEVTVM